MTIRIASMVAVSVACVCVAPFIGESLDGDEARFILVSLRIPRVVLAILVGGTLGLVGACYQTVLANPLATPSTVGTTGGATLGALIAIMSGASSPVSGVPLTTLAAFAGALFVTMIITSIASTGRARTADILLAGIAISLALAAASTGFQFFSDNRDLAAGVRWSLGDLSQIDYDELFILLPFLVPTALILLYQTRALEALVTGEQRAHSQGVDVGYVRSLTLGIGALGVGACVALCGPIAFVGLIVPHLVRLSMGASRRILLPMSFVFGAAFLALCDAVARVSAPHSELPVGVVTAAIGAPALTWLVVRSSRAVN
ncbi:MAG: iron ABC transporter permease [Proteobacteria bacterium]|nr:iron ABC transporter permease [Pseudomonadota bacterium]